MYKFVTVLGCSVLMGACSVAPTKFKESLVINNQVKYAGIESIAHSSTDVLDFARKIYTKQSDKKDIDSVVVEQFLVANKNLVEQKRYDAVDRQIFSTYCNAKRGEIFQWDASSRTTAYGRFRGVNKRFVTCEINSKIESALLYESYGRDSTIFPYETFTTYANGQYIEKIFEEGKVKGYSSSNGVITIPLSKIHDPADRFNSDSNIYTVTFKYKNTTLQPVEINLQNSYIMLNGAKYELGKYSKETVSWSIYDDSDQNVFSGEKGDHMSKLRLNPSQKMVGEFRMLVPGLTRLTREDMKSLVVRLDGITCDGFKIVTYYDMNKKTVQKAVAND